MMGRVQIQLYHTIRQKAGHVCEWMDRFVCTTCPQCAAKVTNDEKWKN